MVEGSGDPGPVRGVRGECGKGIRNLDGVAAEESCLSALDAGPTVFASPMSMTLTCPRVVIEMLPSLISRQEAIRRLRRLCPNWSRIVHRPRVARCCLWAHPCLMAATCSVSGNRAEPDAVDERRLVPDDWNRNLGPAHSPFLLCCDVVHQPGSYVRQPERPARQESVDLCVHGTA